LSTGVPATALNTWVENYSGMAMVYPV